MSEKFLPGSSKLQGGVVINKLETYFQASVKASIFFNDYIIIDFKPDILLYLQTNHYTVKSGARSRSEFF